MTVHWNGSSHLTFGFRALYHPFRATSKVLTNGGYFFQFSFRAARTTIAENESSDTAIVDRRDKLTPHTSSFVSEIPRALRNHLFLVHRRFCALYPRDPTSSDIKRNDRNHRKCFLPRCQGYTLRESRSLTEIRQFNSAMRYSFFFFPFSFIFITCQCNIRSNDIAGMR